MEYVRKQFRGDVQRVDMVFEKDGLKAVTRSKRGKYIRRHVEWNKQVPSNRQDFQGIVIVTRDDEVLSSAPCDLAGLKSCTHEEADMPEMELNMG